MSLGLRGLEEPEFVFASKERIDWPEGCSDQRPTITSDLPTTPGLQSGFQLSGSAAFRYKCIETNTNGMTVDLQNCAEIGERVSTVCQKHSGAPIAPRVSLGQLAIHGQSSCVALH
jgi:hypothetical protein